ncbi:hypothetical protein L7F22_047579 [Adiantum nelumboides]|nr:hypothetical protein [Adiantum nelumboides]
MAEDVEAMKIKLKASDGEEIEVEEELLRELGTLQPLLRLGRQQSDYHTVYGGAAVEASLDGAITIPVPGIPSSILHHVIDFCRHYSRQHKWSEKRFLRRLGGTAALFDLAMAADYLQVASLVDFTATAIADKLRRKSLADLQRMLKLDCPVFTPAEEEQLFRDNMWAFDGMHGY